MLDLSQNPARESQREFMRDLAGFPLMVLVQSMAGLTKYSGMTAGSI